MSEAVRELPVRGLVEVTRRQATLLLEAGYIYMDLGDFDSARQVFDGAAALFPRSEVPHLALGNLEFSQGHHAKALRSFRAAQQLAPRSGLPRAHCGEVLLFMGKHLEADKDLKAALALEPEGDGARLAAALLDAQACGALPPPSTPKRSTP